MKIIRITPMTFKLEVLNPYILCFHHNDFFPTGKSDMSPSEYLPNRSTDGDFDLDAPWRMYYGTKIPGFPVHPHRGFETISIVTKGFADHFDSKGSKGRYGQGDVQWMTAGKGVQHSEMFPLVYEDKENPMELFQIWLNLPKKDKMVEPAYKMLWSEHIPIVKFTTDGAETRVKVIAGEFKGTQALSPTPHSWAADKENKVRILLIELDKRAEITLKPSTLSLGRMLYAYSNNNTSALIDNEVLDEGYFAQLKGDEEVLIQNRGESTLQLLLLEGEPINEPIAAHGPFVMNTREEIIQAFDEFQRTDFGGWPWPSKDPVNEQKQKRFASYHHGESEDYPSSTH